MDHRRISGCWVEIKFTNWRNPAAVDLLRATPSCAASTTTNDNAENASMSVSQSIFFFGTYGTVANLDKNSPYVFVEPVAVLPIVSSSQEQVRVVRQLK